MVRKFLFIVPLHCVCFVDNPLVCDKSIDWFVRYLVTNNVRTFLPEQRDVVCAAPDDLKGVRLKELMIKKAEQTFNQTLKGVC
jgi:hypothetical protein